MPRLPPHMVRPHALGTGLAVALLGGCIDLDALDRCSREPCPPVRTCALEIRAGWSHTCARKVDGTVWCWGINNAVQLGATDGGVAMRPVPGKVEGIEGATGLAVGDSHSCAVTDGGRVLCWGYNSNGQLGASTQGSAVSAIPLSVGSLSGVSSVAAGWQHNCALKGDTTVWCWGNNLSGQLGDGTTVDSTAPVRAGTLTEVAQVAAAEHHSCALRRDGTVWCWGSNTYGQLGDGTRTARSTPSKVLISDAATIGAGFLHSCAAKRDGTLWCWGHNGRGELGNGDTEDQATPVQVVGLTGIVQVALDGFEVTGMLGHTCARNTIGATWCWGDNTFGQIGDGTTTQRLTPTLIASVPDAVDLGAGHKISCVVRRNGTPWCWGANDTGQIGDSTYAERHVPQGSYLPCP